MGTYLGVKVNLVPLTSPNRIPFLLTNKVDLIVATFGITPERAKQVMFSIPYSAIENVVFAGKDKKIANHRGPERPARRRAARHGAGRDPDQDAGLRGEDGCVSMMIPARTRRFLRARSMRSPKPD